VDWKNRIVGHGEEEPEQLLANPLNFRRHPGPQFEALRGSLAELGWVKSVLVNRLTGHVVDGHARIEEAMRQKQKSIPVDYVELTEEEERLALAVLDPISEMATRDESALKALLAEVETEDEGLRSLLREMEGEPAESIEVHEMDFSRVEDTFWMSVRGPLPQQLAALERLKTSLEELPGVEVNIGATNK
jgi:ParB-like chromosome segregation protein Spo0J